MHHFSDSRLWQDRDLNVFSNIEAV